MGPNCSANVKQDGVIYTDAHFRAVSIYRSINGVSAPASSVIIAGDYSDTAPPLADQEYMAKHIQNYYNGSDPAGLVKAARLATREDNFYNTTIRDMAKRMSNRAESVDVPFNDMVATFIGVADGIGLPDDTPGLI